MSTEAIENPKPIGRYANKKLDCGGRVCPKCGNCRDWYHDNGPDKERQYQKRDDATCLGDTPRNDYRNFGYALDGYRHRIPLKPQHIHPYFRLCACKDNTLGNENLKTTSKDDLCVDKKSTDAPGEKLSGDAIARASDQPLAHANPTDVSKENALGDRTTSIDEQQSGDEEISPDAMQLDDATPPHVSTDDKQHDHENHHRVSDEKESGDGTSSIHEKQLGGENPTPAPEEQQLSESTVSVNEKPLGGENSSSHDAEEKGSSDTTTAIDDKQLDDQNPQHGFEAQTLSDNTAVTDEKQQVVDEKQSHASDDGNDLHNVENDNKDK